MSEPGRSRAYIGRIAAIIPFVLTACSMDSNHALTDDDIAALTVPALQQRLANGDLTAERVTRAFLARIDALNESGPAVNAIIEVNPDALRIARDLDRSFAERGPTGSLHGIPVVLKANIDTGDQMATSAGSLALAEHRAAEDAPLVADLRAAGAVILAKTNMSEWANFRSSEAVSGWSSLGGQTHNPYVLDRNPGGSSSGSAVAVAAGLAPLAIGTETDGSIVCPSALNGVVGIKPSHGLISQRGIIPIAASQDTAGPMARSVAGAALLLEALTGESAKQSNRVSDLDGLRLGVIRDFFGARKRPRVEAEYSRWLSMLRDAGAELIDPVNISLDEGIFAAELEVMLYEFKAGLNDYLESASVTQSSLESLIAFNETHADLVMPLFGQELFLQAQAKGGLDEAGYREALAVSGDRVRDRLEDLFTIHRLAALIAPANAPAWKTDWVHADRYLLGSSTVAAVSGYPSITVPAALISELPVAISFIGQPRQEQRLIDIATVFERSRGQFPAPIFIPSLEQRK